jgi:hypothetical protein
MTHVFNIKYKTKFPPHIIYKMEMKDKTYGISFLVIISLQLKKIKLQLKSLSHILCFHF